MLTLQNKLAQAREDRENGEGGFTLIELLVVVVIIGILIAIAIPLYLNYKKGANDKAAQSDLRGAISTLEQCNSDNTSGYPLAGAATGASLGGVLTSLGCSQTINKSNGTTITYFSNPATGTVGTTNVTNYMAISYNSSGNVDGVGTDGYYCYASAAGGSVVKKAAALPTAYAATC